MKHHLLFKQIKRPTKKPLVCFLFCLVGFMPLAVAQTQVLNSSHSKGFKAAEPYVLNGENTNGFGLNLLYYLKDNIHVKLLSSTKNFEYKSYKESIIESGLEMGLTYLEGDSRGRYSFLGFFNLTVTAGISLELVKVKSKTILLEDYPKHTFLHFGNIIEYSLLERVGITLNFRQLYALNGSEDLLGNWRYEASVGLRYYLFN